ncbi:SDR family NAD(P)-dependent oxidoreductase [Bacillus norwichensis]|uniref:SDR family oxidoreductase n=1 Tax=Bacillus norwichensis TaxID=2762217 RepID=A0ABR8VQJ2_9BACI|nr:SDR family NAD(P)-dependent oxidoreductase [Bacillus norwichensis]MBD8006821.1 SDR family oxidoreductase [Bacillus norwichensis]
MKLHAFEEKIVLITGAAGGVGQRVALDFLNQGAKLVLVDLNIALLKKQYKNRDDILIIQADVTEEGGVRNYVQEALNKFGRIDIFFNNAGIEARNNLIEDQSVEDFLKVLHVNTLGVFLGLKYVIPVMKKQNEGAIINTASSVGLVGSIGISPYVAAKHAVVGLNKSAALECADYNVRVNAIAPGFIETNLTKRLIEDTKENQKASEREQLFLNNIPLKRFAKVEEISNLIQYLASPLSSYITGTCVEIDGGRAAK